MTNDALSTKTTACALLTPQGRGAVAVVGLKGPDAEEILDVHFCAANGKPIEANVARPLTYGFWKDTGEDLVVFRRGSNQFEIQCHGGDLASATIIASIQSSGGVVIPMSHYQTQLEGFWKASTKIALSKTVTKRTSELVLRQVSNLPKAIAQVRHDIQANLLDHAIPRLNSMLRHADFGQHLILPRKVVLCGQPNVGKSSLVNAIVGFDRAIVHDVAGTTRDVVTQQTAIDGWPVDMKDTAGLRESNNRVEAIGIEKAFREVENATVRVCIFDASTDWIEEYDKMVQEINPHCVVFNKSDLCQLEGIQLERNPLPVGIVTSATSGSGIPELLREIARHLVSELPGSAESYPVLPVQAQRLKQCLECLEAGDSESAVIALSPSLDDGSLYG